jgi:hypothetical protein
MKESEEVEKEENRSRWVDCWGMLLLLRPGSTQKSTLMRPPNGKSPQRSLGWYE